MIIKITLECSCGGALTGEFRPAHSMYVVNPCKECIAVLARRESLSRLTEVKEKAVVFEAEVEEIIDS